MKTERVDIEQINKNVKNDYKQYIFDCEEKYKNQIYEATQKIIENGNIKFVLLAGPSSSGKTTTSKILMNKLEGSGLKALPISLDDFFVERLDTPKWEDGSFNYESVDAIDWALFSKCMAELLEGKPSYLPTYDFSTGKKSFSGQTTMTKNTIVIIEGLHALNPVIDNFIPSFESYKIYISVNSSLYFDDKLFLNNKEVRLFRRMIRDMYTRATPIKQTLEVWEKVVKGEVLYIDPFVETANYKINSFHAYELCATKYILTHLSKEDEKLEEELKKLAPLDSLDFELVPNDSVLQEFMPKKSR